MKKVPTMGCTTSTHHRRDFYQEWVSTLLLSLELQGEATALGHTDCNGI